MSDWTPFIVGLLAFCAMGGIAFVAGQYYVKSAQLNRRLPAQAAPRSKRKAVKATSPR